DRSPERFVSILQRPPQSDSTYLHRLKNSENTEVPNGEPVSSIPAPDHAIPWFRQRYLFAPSVPAEYFQPLSPVLKIRCTRPHRQAMPHPRGDRCQTSAQPCRPRRSRRPQFPSPFFRTRSKRFSCQQFPYQSFVECDAFDQFLFTDLFIHRMSIQDGTGANQ